MRRYRAAAVIVLVRHGETRVERVTASTRAAPTAADRGRPRRGRALPRRASPAATSRSCSRARCARARETRRAGRARRPRRARRRPARVRLRRLRGPHDRRDPRGAPGLGLWTRRLPGGETVDAGRRARRPRDRPGARAGGDVALVAHGHCCGSLARAGSGSGRATAALALGDGAVCELGFERERRASGVERHRPPADHYESRGGAFVISRTAGAGCSSSAQARSRAIAIAPRRRGAPGALAAEMRRRRGAGVGELVCATAGTRRRARSEPLPAPAANPRAHELWLHVDELRRCVMLWDELRGLLDAVEQADPRSTHTSALPPRSRRSCCCAASAPVAIVPFRRELHLARRAARPRRLRTVHGPRFSRGSTALKFRISLLADGRAAYGRRCAGSPCPLPRHAVGSIRFELMSTGATRSAALRLPRWVPRGRARPRTTSG